MLVEEMLSSKDIETIDVNKIYRIRDAENKEDLVEYLLDSNLIVKFKAEKRLKEIEKDLHILELEKKIDKLRTDISNLTTLMNYNHIHRRSLVNVSNLIDQKNYNAIDSLISLGFRSEEIFSMTEDKDEEVQTYLILKYGIDFDNNDVYMSFIGWRDRQFQEKLGNLLLSKNIEELTEYLLDKTSIIRVIAERKLKELRSDNGSC